MCCRERKEEGRIDVDASLSLLLGEETRRLRIQILNFVFFCAFPNLHIFNYLIVVVDREENDNLIFFIYLKYFYRMLL